MNIANALAEVSYCTVRVDDLEKTLFGPALDVESRTKAKQRAAALARQF